MFKVGDKVRCIDNTFAAYDLDQGKVYTVTSISPCGEYIRIDGQEWGWEKERFETVTEIKTTEKPRVWCGICGVYKSEGDPLDCSEIKEGTCGVIGAPVQFPPFDELPEEATEVPHDPFNTPLMQYVADNPGALGTQVAGDHYKKLKIQPITYILANELQACEANIVKYATRWRDKGGIKDIDKIIHYAQILREWALENGWKE